MGHLRWNMAEHGGAGLRQAEGRRGDPGAFN
jgi:hypothetical protein